MPSVGHVRLRIPGQRGRHPNVGFACGPGHDTVVVVLCNSRYHSGPVLVSDGDGLAADEWVLDGTNSRLAGNPVARFFWRRQKIAMPAYREDLDGEQVAELWQWVEALRADLAAGSTP